MDLHGVELIIVLLAIVIGLATIAERVRIPYPMLLLVAGIAIAFIPGIAHVELDPHLVFLLFLPPVLFAAGYFTSWRDFVANRRPIALLAFGAVIFTTTLVAVVARWLIPDMNWATAFVLGAIVSPPDAVAATAIFQRLGAPRRIVTILEGESLVNDASALIAYSFAVTAVLTGVFSPIDAVGKFLLLGIGGIAFGLLCGYLMIRVTPLAPSAALQIAISLVSPLLIYFLAEELEVSGVLATVAAGIYFGRHSSRTFTPEARIGGVAAWSTGIIVINSLVFILIGLQLRDIVEELDGQDLQRLVWQGLVISLAVIVIRLIWIFPATYLPRKLVPGLAAKDPAPPWQAPFLIGFSGLRGVVSLASALALPLTMDTGESFPYRTEIILFAFIVISVTLLGQGGALPWLLSRLNLTDDGEAEREETQARHIAATAGLARLDELAGESWVPAEHIDEFRHDLEHRLEIDGSEELAEHLEAVDRLSREISESGRAAVVAARDRGEIGDEARQRIETELDLDQIRTSF
jgi:CPA1 family monovalent cation:H+ antiporter